MNDRVEYEFTVKGKRIRATREGVETALRGVDPKTLQVYSVVIGGRRYPIRQAFSLAFGLKRTDTTTSTAIRVLRHLGFDVSSRPKPANPKVDGQGAPAEQRKKPRFPYSVWYPRAAEVERLDLRVIELKWSEWHRWEDLAKPERGPGGVQVPLGTPGVYEAKLEGQEERLAIGRASDLWHRVKQQLVRSQRRHPAGAKIRADEDLSKVRVRWAVTDRPAAAEEDLHQRHMRRFGRLPKYTERT
jgi:hypothetical protein